LKSEASEGVERAFCNQFFGNLLMIFYGSVRMAFVAVELISIIDHFDDDHVANDRPEVAL